MGLFLGLLKMTSETLVIYSLQLHADDGFRARYIKLYTAKNQLYAVGSKMGTQFRVVIILVLDPDTGNVVKEYQPIHGDVHNSEEMFAVGRGGKVFIVWNGANAYVHELGTSEKSVETFVKVGYS